MSEALDVLSSVLLAVDDLRELVLELMEESDTGVEE